MPKLYIKTYGCQMNERDSEQVARMFVQKGYTMTDREDEADVILFNSCSIREQAEQKALGKMGLLAKQQRHRPHVVYGMMGCMAQSKKEELFKELPRLDLVVGTQKYHRVFEHVDGILRARQERRMDELQTAFSGTHVCDVAEEADSQNRIRDHLNPGVRSTAYVSIMQGCEMKCAYCIVPYTRGAERSRPIRDVVDEVKMLADAGVKEVTLLGQIVNRYGRQMARAASSSCWKPCMKWKESGASASFPRIPSVSARIWCRRSPTFPSCAATFISRCRAAATAS